jgi:hypothetical protein
MKPSPDQTMQPTAGDYAARMKDEVKTDRAIAAPASRPRSGCGQVGGD